MFLPRNTTAQSASGQEVQGHNKTRSQVRSKSLKHTAVGTLVNLKVRTCGQNSKGSTVLIMILHRHVTYKL
jgi:hypothetical protein